MNIDKIVEYTLNNLWNYIMRFVEKLFLSQPQESDSPSSHHQYDIFSVVIICIAFFILQNFCSFYFTQDDNLIQFLPVIIDFCEKLEFGQLSTYNPYQFMGFSPISTGVYALTYPLTFASFLIAKHILHNPYLLIEVFAFTHLVLGYFMMSRFVKLIGASATIATVGALCFVLSGYSVLVGRCWYYMLPLLFWTPAIMYTFIQVIRTSKIQWIFLNALAVGMSFHSGNAQMWIYTIIFYWIIIAILYFSDKIILSKVLTLSSAFFLSMAIAAPLFYLQYDLTQKMPSDVWGSGIHQGVWSMIFPWPIITSPYPIILKFGQEYQELEGQLFYSGTIFSLLGLLSIPIFLSFPFLIKKKEWKEFFCNNFWLACGILAFAWGLGNEGPIWPLMKEIRPFNRFSNPFKFLHFINFFFITSGSLILQRIFSFSKNRKMIELLFLILMSGLMLFHISISKASFNTAMGFKPYPQLIDPVKSVTQSGYRIYSEDQRRYLGKNYEQTLPHNFPTIYKIPAWDGIDNITYRYHLTSTLLHKNLTTDIMQEYGIKYFLSASDVAPSLESADAKIFYQDNNFKIWELPNPLPLVFSDNKKQDFPIKYVPTGLEIDISKLQDGNSLTINFAYYPQFEASIDDDPSKVILNFDLGGRVVAKILKTGKILKINYRPDYFSGFILSVIFIILSFGLLLLQHGKVGKSFLTKLDR